MTDVNDIVSDMYGKRGESSDTGDITSHEQLLEHYGQPSDIGLRMHINHLPETYQAFIRRAPLVVLGTVSKDGMPSTSPKGDAPGFVKIVDKKTLLIPDRPGNNQIDALHNLLDNPKLSLIFFIPGARETLRVQGTAKTTTDSSLRAEMAVNGKLPPVIIKMTVVNAYMHCGKALIRSKFWNPDTFAKKGEVPSIAQATLDLEHNKDLPGTIDEWEERAEQVYRDTLY